MRAGLAIISIIVLANGDGARTDAMALEVAKHYIPALVAEPAAAGN